MIDREALKNVLCGESHSLNAVDAIADWIDLQISAAVAAERDACADLCAGYGDDCVANDIADAIRASGDKEQSK